MKLVLVVGGAGLLGRSIVSHLADRGYKVAVAGRTKPADERVKRFYQVDVTSVDWRSLYNTIEKQTDGSIDAVIFVAGSAVFGRTSLIPVEEARQTFEINFWSSTTAALAAAEYWEQRRIEGTFVAILSISARLAVPFEAYYSASKAGAQRFLECLQLEYASRNQRFICAFPGRLKTPFRRQAAWYGMDPNFVDIGADPRKTAWAVIRLLEGNRRSRVIGWRERGVDLANRFLPGLYDRVILRRRIERLFK
jgi:NAD(P)-dependent dehydrogenase (short-subunit alcohol dehydrogenase family)